MTALPPRSIGLPAAALFVALLTSEAGAVERQHHVGLGPEIAVLNIDGKSTASVGAGGAIHYTYGLSDAWNLTFEASSAVVALDQQQDLPTSPRNRPAAIDHGSAGAAYVIDILRWVPYIGLSGGLFRLVGGTLDEPLILPGLTASAGIDYQLSRHVAVGIGIRQHVLPSKLDTYPSYTTGLLRLEYAWGY